MKPELKYIELKSGYSDNGPAWIGKVEFSKSGKTVYFNGQAFKGNGHGTCLDFETGDEYWISGIKKDGNDRHWAGGGTIMIDKNVVDEYLQIVNVKELDKSVFELIEVINTDKQKFKDLENEKYLDEELNPDLRFKKPNELSDSELEFVIQDLKEGEENAKFNKGRRSFKRSRVEFEEELENRNKKNVL